jgi:hypothetical protein
VSHSVALVVIARDEAPRIGRLLASVAPWVDRLCVLDTGSVDATVEVARTHGATVRPFTWCDDFSAARNAALDMADADWHLVLDADEWLVSGGEAIRELAGTAADFVGAVRMEEHFGAAGNERADSWLSRVLPGSVRYVGRIHEQPSHSLAIRRMPIHIGHDGYAPAALAAKRGRNRRLLEADLAERPDDAYLCYQLGKDAAVYDEHELAENFFSRALPLADEHAPWRCDLVARRLFGLKRLGRHAQALTLATVEQIACAESPDVFFALGDVLLDWAVNDPAQASALLAKAETAWLRCLAIGERPDIAGAVQGRGGRLAAHNLALVYEFSARPEMAAGLRAKFGLDTRQLLG